MANDDISGQVTDASGNPVSNAVVYLWREDLVGSGGVVEKTTADSTGAFSFAAHPDGTGSSQSWHVAAEDPNNTVQLLSAYGVSSTIFYTTADIPSSVKYRWRLSSGTGNTLTDSISGNDGTRQGASWVADSNFQGGNALSFNGSSDYVTLTKLNDFGSNLSTDFAIGLTVKTSSSSGRILFGQSSSDGIGGTSGDATTLSIGPESNSEMKFELGDQDNNAINITAAVSGSITDGNEHRYLFSKSANSASGMEIYRDATQLNKSVVKDQPFSNTINFDLNPVNVGRKKFNGGFETGYFNGVIDDIIIYSLSLSSSQVNQDYNLQPYS